MVGQVDIAFQSIFQKLVNFGELVTFFASLEERTMSVDCVSEISASVLRSSSCWGAVSGVLVSV